MLRTTQNKIYRQGAPDPPENKELEDGFPAKPEELFRYQGLIIGSVEANYFTPTQQQLIRDFVDRRGGGLLFLGGRATLSDGGYASSPLADLVPTKLPEAQGHVPSRFHRPGTDAAGRAKRDLPPGRRPGAQRRALEKDARRWPTTRKSARPSPAPPRCCSSTPAGKSQTPAAGDRELRPRPHHALRHRRRLALEDVAADHDDKTHATFWQQMFRYLVTDTPGQVVGTTPQAGAVRRHPSAASAWKCATRNTSP